jgi:hypothetical protein
MPKYHIGSNGPSACRARVRACPLGGESGNENHFPTKAEAEVYHQKSLSDEHGLLKTSKRVSEDSDSQLLAPISIAIPKKAVPFDEFVKVYGEYGGGTSNTIRNFCTDIYEGRVPQNIPSEIAGYGSSSLSMSTMQVGHWIQSCGMYGKITKDTASDLAEVIGDGIVLDPMAGNGWAAKALREAGVKTIASDDDSWNISKDIEKLDAMESLKKYGNKISHLLISWAPYGSDIDVKLLREARENFPQITIINVGEGEQGCTGSPDFWNEIEEIDPGKRVRYETTFGLHDHITFGK